MLTVARKLIFGADVDGVTHSDFVMRPPTISDAIMAIEKAGDNPSSLRLRIFKAAEQMISLGTVEKAAITGELLMSLPHVSKILFLLLRQSRNFYNHF